MISAGIIPCLISISFVAKARATSTTTIPKFSLRGGEHPKNGRAKSKAMPDTTRYGTARRRASFPQCLETPWLFTPYKNVLAVPLIVAQVVVLRRHGAARIFATF